MSCVQVRINFLPVGHTHEDVAFLGYPKGCVKMELKHSMVQIHTISYTRLFILNFYFRIAVCDY